jgi:hypothetical protein
MDIHTAKKILAINACIQHTSTKVLLDGQPVMAVALDLTVAVGREEKIALTDAQLDALYLQVIQRSGPVILDSRWWTMRDGAVGIVAVQTFLNEWKAYIGAAPLDHHESATYAIAYHGAGLQAKEAAVFFPRLDIAQYKKEVGEV